MKRTILAAALAALGGCVTTEQLADRCRDQYAMRGIEPTNEMLAACTREAARITSERAAAGFAQGFASTYRPPVRCTSTSVGSVTNTSCY